MDCLFCQMVEKKIPTSLIYEDEMMMAFHDIQPRAPIHLLLIPKKHIAHLNDVSHDDALLLGQLLQRAAILAKEMNIADSGYRVVNNCNAAGGQTVFHLHFHLLGGRAMQWPPG